MMEEPPGYQPAQWRCATGPDQASALLEGLANVGPVNWNGPHQTVISGERGGRRRGRGASPTAQGSGAQVAGFVRVPFADGRGAPAVRWPAWQPNSEPGRCVARSSRTRVLLATPPTLMRSPRRSRPISQARCGSPRWCRPCTRTVRGPSWRSDRAARSRPWSSRSSRGSRTWHWLAIRAAGRESPGLLQTLARLFVAGVPLKLGRLTAGRRARLLDRVSFTAEQDTEANGAAMWLVNGTRARPVTAAGPSRGSDPAPHCLPPERQTPAVDTHPERNGHMPAPSKNGNGFIRDTNPRLHASRRPSRRPGIDRVVEAFQKTMQTFLEVQRDTMLALLGVFKRPMRRSRNLTRPAARLPRRRCRPRQTRSARRWFTPTATPTPSPVTSRPPRFRANAPRPR